MSDDLVARLRSRLAWGSRLADEAADEIERLRSEVEELKKENETWRYTCSTGKPPNA
jgi:hypothetical protein